MWNRYLPPRGRVFAFCALASCAAAFTVVAAPAPDTLPRVDTSLPHPQPPYPDSAQVSGEEGTVQLEVYVRPNGRATKVSVSKSSGFQDLDTAAVQGVLNWRYIPAIKDGDTVSDWTTVKVEFALPRAPTQPSN
jgi:protein TonB